MNFLSPDVALYLCRSTIQAEIECCCHVWTGVPSSFSGVLIKKLRKWICRQVYYRKVIWALVARNSFFFYGTGGLGVSTRQTFSSLCLPMFAVTQSQFLFNLRFWWILKHKDNMLSNKFFFFTAFILGFRIAWVQNLIYYIPKWLKTACGRAFVPSLLFLNTQLIVEM